MSRAQRPIPQALLERYAAGDLPPEQQQHIAQQLAASADEQRRLDELRADSAAFLVKHPPGPLAAALSPARRPRWLTALAPALAVAAVAVLAVVYRGTTINEPDIGVKGAVSLTVWRQTPSGEPERLSPGAPLKAGDQLRFEVRAPRDGWVAVLSRDGAGAINTYYPPQGEIAARYLAAEPVLPGAIGLDDTTGTETLWVLFSERPFTLNEPLRTLRAGGMLLSTSELTVVSEARPKTSQPAP